jgi:hypothetical protein
VKLAGSICDEALEFARLAAGVADRAVDPDLVDRRADL